MSNFEDATERYIQALRNNGVDNEMVIDLMVAGFNSARAIYDEDFKKDVEFRMSMLRPEPLH